MKVLVTSLLLVAAGVAPDGDPVKDGLRLYKEGHYAEAAVAFREALVGDPDNARLNYNLALALWRSGDADGAETAAEKASALTKGEFDGLRDGILGNLRYDKARALADAKVEPQKEVARLEEAVAAVGTARQHFQRSAVELLKRSPSGSAEVQRNLERAIKLEEELKQRLEDAKKKQKEQQKKPDDKNEKDDPDKKEDEKKDPTQDDKKDDDKNQDPKEKKEQPEPDPKKKEDEKEEQKPEKDEEDQKKDEKKPDEEKNKPHEPGKPQEVPGEHDPDKQLTPEQRRELLKRLQEFDANLKKLKAARKAARPKVKKDW